MASVTRRFVLSAGVLACNARLALGSAHGSAKHAKHAEEFACDTDYGKGKGDWRTTWSAAEQEWCCKHKKLGCSVRDDGAADHPFDCEEGFANWAQGWSREKKTFCCTHTGKGCPVHDKGGSKAAVVAGAAEAPGAALVMKSSPEAVAASMLAAAQPGQCGVSSVRMDDGDFVAPKSVQPVCERRMTTNCSVSYASMRCPTDCEYFVPDHHFVCVFECVPARKCSASNANRAFPDPLSRTCRHCQVEACVVCDSETRCTECHPGFKLSADGSQCVFNIDASLQPQNILNAVGMLVVAIVFLGLGWRCVRGDHPNKDANATAIARARLHRHLCKAQNWTMFNSKKVREWYPLLAQVHSEHIVGVGLPLFYNSICFMAVVSLLCFGCTYWVFSRSPLAYSLASPGDWQGSTLSLAAAVAVPSQQPAVVFSPLAACGDTSAAAILADVRNFAYSNFRAIGLLYVAVFAVSLAHAAHQQRAAIRFDSRNKTMSDFALRVTGLKRDIVDEAKLTFRMRDAFRAACPRGDGEAPVEVIGVSVCYDYSKVWGEVDAMRDRFMERMEVDMDNKVRMLQKDGAELSSEAQISVAVTSARTAEEMRVQVDKDREQAKRWFDDKSVDRLKSTGEAFVVFQHSSDRDAVWAVKDRVEQTLNDSVGGSNCDVKLFKVFSEPPSVNWWHLAVPPSDMKRNVQRAMLKILGIIAVVQLCIVLPYAYFIVWPYSKTGSRASGAKMQIAGVILGNVNMFVSLQIFFTSFGLGFHRKDGVDILVLCANTALVMINTAFNIFMNALMVFSMNDEGFGPDIFFTIDSLVAIGSEGTLAASIYDMMMPGTFFVGYIMCIIMAGVVPFVWNTFLMKVIYIWRCLPDCLLNVLKVFLPWAGDLSLEHYPYRRAERGFEPMEISIGWDYTAMIVTPSVCFCMLFFVSPYVWRTFQMLFFSTIFQYFFFRYQHLRFCKACFFTTNRLDSIANYLWGIPLSIIAAAWCVWGFRSGAIEFDAPVTVKFMLISAAFFGSFFTWAMTYHFALKPFEQRDAEEDQAPTFDDVKADLLYSWFNCNPVYVLKCEYYFQDSKTCDSISHTPGALKVTILSARGLRDADWLPGAGDSDVRVACELVGKPGHRIETGTCKDPKNARWDYVGELRHYLEGDQLQITLADKDVLNLSSVLGKVVLTGDQVRDAFRGEVEIDMGARYGKAYLDIRVDPPTTLAALTKVTIKSAKDLRDSDWLPGSGKSDPYVVCSVVGKPESRLVTPIHLNKNCPVWNFVSGLDLDDGDSLLFKVMDHDSFFHDDCLGTATLSNREVRAGFAGELRLDKNGERTEGTIKVRVEPPEDGARRVSTSRRGHPLACGEDPEQVRFFEVGKEYLFFAPEKQGLVRRDGRQPIEVETIMEYILAVFGAFVSLCVSSAKKQVNSAEKQLQERLKGLPLSSDAMPLLSGGSSHAGEVLLGSERSNSPKTADAKRVSLEP